MERNNLKTPVYASLMLAFAGIGDAFLYPFLPVHYQSIGLSISSVGILLSINRFVRLFTNRFIVQVFSRFGFKQISILASVLAVITTIAYGFLSLIWTWILVRILWGLCFSALRLSSFTYALESKRKGFFLGLSSSLNELGPIIALLSGPLIISIFNIQTAFLILGVLSAPAIFFASRLPKINYTKNGDKSLFLTIPSTFNLIIFISSLVIEGILIVTVSVIITKFYTDFNQTAIIAMTAFYLSFRRICKVIFSPVAGWLSDKVGVDTIFVASLLIICIGLLLLSIGVVPVGLILIFLFNGINTAVVPGNATSDASDKIKALSDTSTWRDLGTSVGTLTGALLLEVNQVNTLFWIPGLIIVFLLSLYNIKSRFFIKMLFVNIWKRSIEKRIKNPLTQ